MAEVTVKAGKSHKLTEGNITRQLIILALPLLAGNIIQQFYNTVDMIIVGKFVGDNAFGAIGICGSVFNLFTCILIGLNMGFAILYANHYGAGDYDKLRKTIFATVAIGVTVAVLLSLGGIFFLEPILTLIRTPETMMDDCRIYLFWGVLGLIFAFFYNSFAAMLRAIGKTDITFWVLIISMVTNIILDYTLVAVSTLLCLGRLLRRLRRRLFLRLLAFIISGVTIRSFGLLKAIWYGPVGFIIGRFPLALYLLCSNLLFTLASCLFRGLSTPWGLSLSRDIQRRFALRDC